MNIDWLVVYLPLWKYESQLGWWHSHTFPIDGKKCSKPPTRYGWSMCNLCVIYYCDTFHWEILNKKCLVLHPSPSSEESHGGSSQPFLAAAGDFFCVWHLNVETPAGNNFFVIHHQNTSKLLNRQLRVTFFTKMSKSPPFSGASTAPWTGSINHLNHLWQPVILGRVWIWDADDAGSGTWWRGKSSYSKDVLRIGGLKILQGHSMICSSGAKPFVDICGSNLVHATVSTDITDSADWLV